jgi:hypothetical protein
LSAISISRQVSGFRFQLKTTGLVITSGARDLFSLAVPELSDRALIEPSQKTLFKPMRAKEQIPGYARDDKSECARDGQSESDDQS